MYGRNDVITFTTWASHTQITSSPVADVWIACKKKLRQGKAMKGKCHNPRGAPGHVRVQSHAADRSTNE